MNTKAVHPEQIMKVFHRYPQNTEEIPKEKYLLPIHQTFIENLFTTTIFLLALQLCFPVTDRRINVLHTRRFGRWLSHYINLLLIPKLVSENCVLTDRLLRSYHKGSEVRLSLSIPRRHIEEEEVKLHSFLAAILGGR
jgi:hypothetical protein